jgi:hypothetical protein
MSDCLLHLLTAAFEPLMRRSECLKFGVNQKYLARARNDANDP